MSFVPAGTSHAPVHAAQKAPGAYLGNSEPNLLAQMPASNVRSETPAAPNPVYSQPNLQLPPRPTVSDLRIRRAEDRFQAGKRLFAQADYAGAHREFDAAIDILLNTPEKETDRIKAERKLEELIGQIHKYDVERFGAASDGEQPGYDKAPLEDILEATFPINPGLKPKVKEQLSATVSQLPLELNDVVLSYINYFSTDRGRRTLLAGLRRAGQYKPMIQRILQEEGVPQELIFLAQAESGFLPRAVSSKAAAGMWQFVQWRGREYGLQRSSYADERLDPEKATRSAAKHLRDLYQMFGDWYLAIAGYNCGPGCVERAVERTGYADFWELRSRNAIPRETSNYVPIILAMTIMAKNPAEYGLQDIEIDRALEYETVQLTVPTHLALVADAVDKPVAELRNLNPALLASVAPAGYELRIPKDSSKILMAGLDAVPEEKRTCWRLHRVSTGEDLLSISRAYRVSTASISAVNNLDGRELADLLIIPTAPQAVKSTRIATASRNLKAAASRATLRGKKSTQHSASRTPRRRGSSVRASLR